MGSRCAQSLPPRSTGQWLDAFLGFTPICFAPICFAPLCFVPPLSFPPRASFAVSGIVSSPHTPQLHFVRSCYSWREHPAVSETSMRDSSSFLGSPLSPLWHLFTPHHLSPAYSFAELAPSPFPRPRISLANRYFSTTAFPRVRTNAACVIGSYVAITVLQ